MIGAGASGMACAIRLKQLMPSCSVTVLEHLEEPCKKLYATGNGRCNITNTSAAGYPATKAFFESLGLVLKESNEGRMYPYSNQAAGVVGILLSSCKKLNIRIVTSCNAHRIIKSGACFSVYTSQGRFNADYVVLATGGKAQSALGSDGSGYELASSFGHTVTPLSPALVQLVSSSKHCRALKGVRTKCLMKIEVNGDIVAEDSGELLFADYGLSGIVTMNLSRYVSDERLKSGKDKCVAVIDFVPEFTEEQLKAHFDTFGSLEGILPAKLCSILMKQANDDSEKAVHFAKNWRLIITGTKGYSFAQITAGGVSNGELSDGQESHLCGKLFIVGELTDNQFPCGGFNLDYAFSSGIRAAEAIAEKESTYNDQNT